MTMTMTKSLDISTFKICGPQALQEFEEVSGGYSLLEAETDIPQQSQKYRKFVEEKDKRAQSKNCINGRGTNRKQKRGN